MKNEKKKGGKRSGAGRRPSEVKKEAVTIYTDVSKFGGKEGARMAIYEFLNGNINLINQKSFMPLPESTLVALHNAENKDQLTTAHLMTQKQLEALNEPPKEDADIQKRIDEIKAEKIPKERDTPMGRKAWELDKKKRIQELQNKLK